MSLITPHGGKLVNRVLSPEAARDASASAGSLPAITLSNREQGDLEMIAIGAFSPLVGFMGRKDFASVCKDMRLADGNVWPIPVTLSPPNDVSARIKEGQKVALKDDTHFNNYGGYELARCVVEAIRRSDLPLAKHLATDVTPFDPSKPDDVEKFRLRTSATRPSERPEGS